MINKVRGRACPLSVTTYSCPSRLSIKSSGLHGLPLVVHEPVVAPASTSPQSSHCIPTTRASPSFLEPSMGIITGKQTVNMYQQINMRLVCVSIRRKTKHVPTSGPLHLWLPLLKQFPLGLQLACSPSSGFYSRVTSSEISFLATLSKTVSHPLHYYLSFLCFFVYYAKHLSQLDIIFVIIDLLSICLCYSLQCLSQWVIHILYSINKQVNKCLVLYISCLTKYMLATLSCVLSYITRSSGKLLFFN